MTGKRPDFAEQIRMEMNLTAAESQEFLRFEVAWLAVLVTRRFIDDPECNPFENQDLIREYGGREATYEELLAKASPRIIEAMKRLFQMEIDHIISCM